MKQKAYTIGLKTSQWRRWSDSEVKLLKKLYPDKRVQSIADKLGRFWGEIFLNISLFFCHIRIKSNQFSKETRMAIKENTLLVGIIVGAICFVIGFGGGAILTQPERAKWQKQIKQSSHKVEALSQENKHLYAELDSISSVNQRLSERIAKLEQANKPKKTREQIIAEKEKRIQKKSGFAGKTNIVDLIKGFQEQRQEEVSTKYMQLKAFVSFDDGQFKITNNDNFNWHNVEFELNGGIIKSGYKLRATIIEANSIYTVGAMQFTKKDGTRFDPFTHKPQKFNIWCDTSTGKGCYYAAWD